MVGCTKAWERARGCLSGHTDRPDQLDRQEVHTKRRTRHATRHESARREPTRTQNGNRSACFGYTFVGGIFEPADISRDAHGPAHAPTGRSLALRRQSRRGPGLGARRAQLHCCNPTALGG